MELSVIKIISTASNAFIIFFSISQLINDKKKQHSVLIVCWGHPEIPVHKLKAFFTHDARAT